MVSQLQLQIVLLYFSVTVSFTVN